MAVTTSRRFDEKITDAADTAWNGEPYVVQIGQSQLDVEVQPTGASYEYKTVSLDGKRLSQVYCMRLASRLGSWLLSVANRDHRRP